MRKFVVTALAAIALAGAVAPAMAETVSVAVSYSDLDLTSAAGKKALETRVAVAIKTVCAKPEARTIKSMKAWESCKTDAADSASEQMARSIQLASL